MVCYDKVSQPALWVGDAYLHAIVEPPSEVHHPLWREATCTQLDDFGLKTKKPLYRRHTTSTAIQLVVDHAFTGTYATHF